MDIIGSATAWVMGDAAAGDTVMSALAAASWSALKVTEIPEPARGTLSSVPAVIVVALAMPDGPGLRLAGPIRERPDAIGRLPIIAFGTGDMPAADVLAGGFDDFVQGDDCDALVRVAERWRPEGLPTGFTKLTALFGANEGLALLDGFRSLLITVLGDGIGDRAAGPAHRVAGMAGMLGFAELGQAWLGLSEGEEVDPLKLRRLTRRAIVAIDRAL